MDTDNRLLHCWKAKVSMSVTLLGIITDVKSEPAKAHEPIDVTEFGISKVSKPFNCTKALAPMAITEFGMLMFLHPHLNVLEDVSITALQLLRESYTLFLLSTMIVFKLLQPEKIQSPIVETFCGIIIDIRFIQSLNASSGIVVSPVKYCNSSKVLIEVLPLNTVPKFDTPKVSALLSSPSPLVSQFFTHSAFTSASAKVMFSPTSYSTISLNSFQ